MNVNLPPTTAAFADVVSKALRAEHVQGPAALYSALDELGVLDLLSADSADAENAQLNTAVSLEEVARAGHRAPVAETIWAKGQGLACSGFVAMAADAGAGGDRLVAYGALAEGLVIGPAGSPRLKTPPGEMAAAHLEIDPGHSWVPADVEAPSLDAVDQGYAWRAAAAITTGAMAGATDMAITHAQNRVQFGKPLASFQVLQFRLAECHWRLMGLRLLVREAAWRADRRDGRADTVSALAWLYAREVGRIVTKHAHQLHGAIGFTRELGLTEATGSVAVLRGLHPAGPAARTVRAGRHIPDPADPPSNVLGGFRLQAGS